MSFTANYAHSRVSKLKIENHNIKTFSYFYFVNPWLEFCGWFFALSLSDFEFWLRTQILIGWDQKTLIKLEPKLIIPDVSLFCQKSLVKAKKEKQNQWSYLYHFFPNSIAFAIFHSIARACFKDLVQTPERSGQK